MGVACLLYTEQHPHLIMGKGQNEGGFSEEQVQMYKDCFKLTDINKDGQLDKNDLREAFDNEGKIDSKMFEHALMTWGDKMTKAEIDDIFGEFEIDEDYMIKTKDVIGLFVSVKEEPKVEEPAPAPVEEAPAEEDEGEAKKKKKKKKKAAK